MIFTRSVIGIFPAAAGLALTAEEESLFRQQLESIRAFSKKESPIEDFACEYLEGNIKIKAKSPGDLPVNGGWRLR